MVKGTEGGNEFEREIKEPDERWPLMSGSQIATACG